MLTPELYAQFSKSNGTLGVLQLPEGQSAPDHEAFESGTLYFWDYLWSWPPLQGDLPSVRYVSVMDKYLVEVELGRLSPATAVEEVVRELNRELGDSVVVGP